MPEGDTLYRIATRLRPVLVDRKIESATAWRPRSGPPINAAALVGQQVSSVEAVGKHLLIEFENRSVLHSHLGMTGSWHLYPLGAEWRKPAHRAAVTLATNSQVAVCFTPKLIELTTTARLRANRHLRRLGPDLMRAETDPAAALPRLRSHNAAPIGEAVMNQTLVCGIGNIYKSESLFLARINPWRPVGEIPDAQLLDYLRATQQLMRNNRGGGERVTRFADGTRLWVYGRLGEACLVCGGKVQMRRQGDLGRSTYFCPVCQPVVAPGPRPR